MTTRSKTCDNLALRGEMRVTKAISRREWYPTIDGRVTNAIMKSRFRKLLASSLVRHPIQNPQLSWNKVQNSLAHSQSTKEARRTLPPRKQPMQRGEFAQRATKIQLADSGVLECWF